MPLVQILCLLLKVSSATVRDHHPFPLLDEFIDLFGESRFFNLGCKLKLLTSEIGKHDHEKFDFTGYQRLYQFVRMTFGLKNASAIIQPEITAFFCSVKWQSALYLHAIVILLKTVVQHLNHLQYILMPLRDLAVALRIKKCLSSVETISYHNHTIHPGKLEMIEPNTDAISPL